VPLAFGAGEALQFDWSEDWAVIAGERTKLELAHLATAAHPVRAYVALSSLILGYSMRLRPV